MDRTNAAARLAQSAVTGAGREVRLDRIERANLDALVAVNTRRLNLALGRTKQIAQRKDRPARTNIFAPEARFEEPQSQHRQEQSDRQVMPHVQWRHQMPTAQRTRLPWCEDEQHAARDNR